MIPYNLAGIRAPAKKNKLFAWLVENKGIPPKPKIKKGANSGEDKASERGQTE